MNGMRLLLVGISVFASSSSPFGTDEQPVKYIYTKILTLKSPEVIDVQRDPRNPKDVFIVKTGSKQYAFNNANHSYWLSKNEKKIIVYLKKWTGYIGSDYDYLDTY